MSVRNIFVVWKVDRSKWQVSWYAESAALPAIFDGLAAVLALVLLQRLSCPFFRVFFV